MKFIHFFSRRKAETTNFIEFGDCQIFVQRSVTARNITSCKNIHSNTACYRKFSNPGRFTTILAWHLRCPESEQSQWQFFEFPSAREGGGQSGAHLTRENLVVPSRAEIDDASAALRTSVNVKSYQTIFRHAADILSKGGGNDE
jgi:hypothetical protein